MQYTLLTKKYEKVGDKWTLLSTEEQEYSFEKWQTHILDSRKFFKSLGGTERLNGNTLTSISPDDSKKTVRTLKRKVKEG